MPADRAVKAERLTEILREIRDTAQDASAAYEFGSLGDSRRATREVEALIAEGDTIVAALLDAPSDCLWCDGKAPTDSDEPPWPGWFSCEDCQGWFTGDGVAYDSGSVVCEACAQVRETPSDEDVAQELAKVDHWGRNLPWTLNIVRYVRAAETRAKEGR